MQEMESGERKSKSGFKARDIMSPNSVANFSHFSSTSGSAERCSFASDLQDHVSLSSEVSQKLAGKESQEICSSGPDLDAKRAVKNSYDSRIDKVQKFESSEAETEDENLYLDSARSSFSQALKECQDRRTRTKGQTRKADRRRPASLDFNNAMINGAYSSSPRLAVMKKTVALPCQAGMSRSPGTPNNVYSSGIQKGWSSERVPLHNGYNRSIGNAPLLPYGNGRVLPSKWDDAERWILSPVPGDTIQNRSTQQQYAGPKSRSGPLAPLGVSNYTLNSPAVPISHGGNLHNVAASSPFSTGVMSADVMSVRYLTQGRGGHIPEPWIARSISVHEYNGMVSQPSLPGTQGVEEDGNCTRDAATDISRADSRRDMGTQMSPESSPCSSPGGHSSCSTSTPSVLPIIEMQGAHFTRGEIRDVQVDKRITVTKSSKKNKGRMLGGKSGNIDDWKNKAAERRCSSWEFLDSAKSISKIKRDEARITAWENLQRAKAEAAIQKLEMKLEKKKSSSMEKIMNKLKSSQKKAQEMRSSVLSNQSHQASRTSHKAISFGRTHQVRSLSGCFTCHAF